METRGLRRRALALLIALSLGSTHLVAFAQTDAERAGARAAAAEGLKAYNDKKYAESIDLFTRAESLVHAPPHLLYLARSYVGLGQLVKAQETYSKITHETIAPEKPKAFHDAKAAAEKEMSELEPRIPAVKVIVQGAPAGKTLKVTIDGNDIPPALVGLSSPVDPGEHKFIATTEGMASDPVTLTIKEGGRETVTLALKASTTAVVPVDNKGTENPGISAPIDGSTTAPSTGTGSQPEAPSSGKSNVPAYVLLGVGAVGLGLGTVFFLGGVSKSNQANDLCNLPGGGCPSDKKDQIDSLDSSAKTGKMLGFIGWGVGGAAAITGIVLLVSGGKSSSSQTSGRAPTITPWVGLGSAGVSGAF